VIFFHDAGDNPRSVDKETTLRKHAARFDLTGDPAHAGFIVLAPQGRALHGNKEGAMFDVDYTGEDNVESPRPNSLPLRAHLGESSSIAGACTRSARGTAGTWPRTVRDDARESHRRRRDVCERRAARLVVLPWTSSARAVVYRACDHIAPCDSVERWMRARDALGAETMGAPPRQRERRRAELLARQEVHRCRRQRAPIDVGPRRARTTCSGFLARHTLSVTP